MPRLVPLHFKSSSCIAQWTENLIDGAKLSVRLVC